jgi:hypothetical protein
MTELDNPQAVTPKKKRKSRANPMTPIMRDLGVAATRLKHAQSALSKLELPVAATLVNIQETLNTTRQGLAESWANRAAEDARRKVMEAYMPKQQPLTPETTVEA